jgi:plasmid maintenance system antidote protein VapI
MDAYFTVESTSGSRPVTFSEVKCRLIKMVNARILNGEFTERGLARILGISQPQIHNVLKGARRLSGELADRLLTTLGWTLLDLLGQEELDEHHRRRQSNVHIEAELDRHFSIGQRAVKKPPRPEMNVQNARGASGFKISVYAEMFRDQHCVSPRFDTIRAA